MPQVHGLDISPFFLPGKDVACLLIHGFCGTPVEFRSTGDFLAAQGWTVDCPLLDGHGTTPNDLKSVTRDDWRATVETRYRALRDTHEKVFVLGLSMGALLSLDLALRHPVDGVVLMAPAVLIRNPLFPCFFFLFFLQVYFVISFLRDEVKTNEERKKTKTKKNKKHKDL